MFGIRKINPPGQFSGIKWLKAEALLGYGSYGIVLKAEGHGSSAFKILYSIDPREVKNGVSFEDEIKNLQPHENIVSCKRIITTDMSKDDIEHLIKPIQSELSCKYHPFSQIEDLKIRAQRNATVHIKCLELQLCGSSLRSRLQDTFTPFPFEHRLHISNQVVTGLTFLHNLNIIHRDLKPENILFSAGLSRYELPVKIADFGLARYLPPIPERLTSHVGTESYMAPERRTRLYGTPADIYSFGIITWETFAKVPGNLPSISDDLKEGKLDVTTLVDGYIPIIELKDVILKMLSTDPSSRPRGTGIKFRASAILNNTSDDMDNTNIHHYIPTAQFKESASRTLRSLNQTYPLSQPQVDLFMNAIDAECNELDNANNVNYSQLPLAAMGIDLGTCECYAAVYMENKVEMLREDEKGQRATPSFVHYGKSGEIIVGLAAKDLATQYPESTIFDAKRLIGRAYDDPSTRDDIRRWPFLVVNGGLNRPTFQIQAQKISPEQVASQLLKKLKNDTEKRIGHRIDKAVITVPAYFTDSQKRATRDAGEIAGLQVLRIVNEPTAAAAFLSLEQW